MSGLIQALPHLLESGRSPTQRAQACAAAMVWALAVLTVRLQASAALTWRPAWLAAPWRPHPPSRLTPAGFAKQHTSTTGRLQHSSGLCRQEPRKALFICEQQVAQVLEVTSAGSNDPAHHLEGVSGSNARVTTKRDEGDARVCILWRVAPADSGLQSSCELSAGLCCQTQLHNLCMSTTVHATRRL